MDSDYHAALVLGRLRKKNLTYWLRDYARHLGRRALVSRPRGPRHVLFALCDHYEPLWGGAPDAVGIARVNTCCNGWPLSLARSPAGAS